MTTLLTAQVTAYADQVRAHLADLGVDVVDDLTDGLEADLAEELADRAAGAGGVTGDDEVVLDLARVFGSAAEYAGELRAAAGLAPAGGAARRSPVRDALRQTAASWREDAGRLLEAIRELPGGRWAVETAVALRPVWWVARGWVWFVGVTAAINYSLVWVDQHYLPQTPALWLLLAGLVLLSVSWGRGLVTRPRVLSIGLGIASAVAAIALLPVAASASQFAVNASYVYTHGTGSQVQTVEVPAPPQDGVVVDGMQVSNLFVYDADGTPLSGVQIVDDRGRPVRTLTDGSASDWFLPGVAEPWAFAPATDAFGRVRWNVYPLLGAPTSDWEWDESGIDRVLAPGAELREPPSPFAEAPALGPASGGEVPSPVAETGASG